METARCYQEWTFLLRLRMMIRKSWGTHKGGWVLTPIQGQKAKPKRSYKKHRRKEEIVANILIAASKNGTKTRIMRTCYISYDLLQKYLNYASTSGLLFRDPRTNKYHLTSKGTQFLNYFHQYIDTESELAHKKRLISNMLETNLGSSIPTFESVENRILTQTPVSIWTNEILMQSIAGYKQRQPRGYYKGEYLTERKLSHVDEVWSLKG
jgi:predicted transcriptional regulator